MDTVDRETGEIMRPQMAPEIAKAIIQVMKQVRQIGADERNEHGKYNYVSVDKFYERIGPMMAEAGLALLINECESEVKASERGTPWLFARYELTFLHESGAMSLLPMSRSLAMPISGPQAYGAAQSYIEKQFLRQVFKVPTGEKDADEIAQNAEAPAGRSGGPTTQEARGSVRNIPRRPEAAPAPSDAAADATKRWHELRAAIDAEEDKEMLLRVEEWPAFVTLNRIGAQAAPEDTHREMMDMLRARAAKRRQQLGGLKEYEL